MRKVIATIVIFLGMFFAVTVPASAQYGYSGYYGYNDPYSYQNYGWVQPANWQGSYGYGSACCLNYAWHDPYTLAQYQPFYYPARPIYTGNWNQQYGYSGYGYPGYNNYPSGYLNLGLGVGLGW